MFKCYLCVLLILLLTIYTEVVETCSFTRKIPENDTENISTDDDTVISKSIYVKENRFTDFTGKVVLITGVTSGVGKFAVFHFAKLGAKLCITSRNYTKLNKIYRSVKKITKVKPLMCAGDLSISEDSDNIVRHCLLSFGKLDILINNAGIYQFGSIYNSTAEQFDRMFSVNVKSMYLLSKFAVPFLEKTKGVIINVSSLAGLRPFPGILFYSMSKAAVDQFTKCLALELGHKGIRVNSVNPSVIDTGFHIKAGMDPVKYKRYIENCKNTHILGRITTIEDVVNAITFLASDQASFITGVNLPVDGGRSIMSPTYIRHNNTT